MVAESNLKGLHPKCFSDSEEEQLAKEVERDLKRQQYEKDHWDEAIVGFRECEKKHGVHPVRYGHSSCNG